ncbi:MAG: 6-bladed beta-propeller [Flavobacteriaceae bacterium]
MGSRRDFLQSSMACATTLLSPSLFWGCDENDPLVVGHGAFQYKVDVNWGALDAKKHPVNDCHEMIQANNGDIYLLTNHIKNNVLIYSLDGRLKASWGTQFPGAHGLTHFDENGTEVLWITDYTRNQVFKTTLEGTILQTIDAPQDVNAYKEKTTFKPTETAIAPDGSIYVADGYGAQLITHFDPNGNLINVFGGYGNGADQFYNAHGICLDMRSNGNPTLLITAREQQAVKRFSLEGEHITTLSLPGAYICRPVINGQNCYFSVLRSSGVGNEDSGFVLIMDGEDQVVSCPAATKYVNEKNVESYRQHLRIFQHPHDVCVDRDENLYVAQWNSGNTYPIKLARI